MNVLIAVISGSYEKAKIVSSVLFGKARVTFEAQNRALESFLRLEANFAQGLTTIESPGKALVVSGKILCWLALISLIVTAVYAEIYLAARTTNFLSMKSIPVIQVIITLLMVVLLTAALWDLFFFAVGGVARGLLPNKLKGCFRSVDWFSGFVVHRTTSRLFGLAEKTRTNASL